MSVPLFPQLQPRTIESLWYCPDKIKNNVSDIDLIETEHQNWINSINRRCMDDIPLGTPVEAPTPEDDDDEDDDDDDDEEEETDESHDNDPEEVIFNDSGAVDNREIMRVPRIQSPGTDSLRAHINRSAR